MFTWRWQYVDYFISLMLKFVNMEYKHLYKQPQFASNSLDTLVFLMNEIDCLGDYFVVILGSLNA